MTIPQFQELSYDDKVDLLYKQGVYIGKQKEGCHTKVLYQLDSFYVEIYYTKYRRLISHLVCFNFNDMLNPYLSQVDVGEIIKYVYR